METIQQTAKEALMQILRDRFFPEYVIFGNVNSLKQKTTLTNSQFWDSIVKEAINEIALMEQTEDEFDRGYRAEKMKVFEAQYASFVTEQVVSVVNKLPKYAGYYFYWQGIICRERVMLYWTKSRFLEFANQRITKFLQYRKQDVALSKATNLNDTVFDLTGEIGTRLEIRASEAYDTEYVNMFIEKLKEIDGKIAPEYDKNKVQPLKIGNINDLCIDAAKQYNKYSLEYVVKLLKEKIKKEISDHPILESAPDTQFIDILLCEEKHKDNVMQIIKKLSKDAKPKKISFIIQALSELNYIALDDRAKVIRSYYASFNYEKGYDTLYRAIINHLPIKGTIIKRSSDINVYIEAIEKACE